MASFIGIILMVTGGINFIWFLIWASLIWSGTAGAKLSKKIGTSNENTDKAIEMGKDFGKQALNKVLISVVLCGIGAILYYLIG